MESLESLNYGYVTKEKQMLTQTKVFVFFLSGSVMAMGDHLLQAITHGGGGGMSYGRDMSYKTFHCHVFHPRWLQ